MYFTKYELVDIELHAVWYIDADTKYKEFQRPWLCRGCYTDGDETQQRHAGEDALHQPQQGPGSLPWAPGQQVTVQTLRPQHP